MKRLILLVVFMMSIAAPYSAAAFAPTVEPVIHWNFDDPLNKLANSGTAASSDLPLASPPPSYIPGLDSANALAFSSGDTDSLTTVMNTIRLLPLTNATVSFNLMQGTSWNHYLLLADNNAGLLTLYMDGSIIHSASTADPIGVLKKITLTNTWLLGISSVPSGAIDDFRVYDYVINAYQIAELSRPALFNRVNTDGSANVSIDEIVKYMNVNQIDGKGMADKVLADKGMAARLLDLIKPIVVITAT